MIVNWSILVSHYPESSGWTATKVFFMHFPSMSRNGQVGKMVVMDKLSSSGEETSYD